MNSPRTEVRGISSASFHSVDNNADNDRKDSDPGMNSGEFPTLKNNNEAIACVKEMQKKYNDKVRKIRSKEAHNVIDDEYNDQL